MTQDMHVYGKFADILTYGRKLLLLLVMITFGNMVAWGQSTDVLTTNGDGYYYITNNSDASNNNAWHLKPATNYYNGSIETPFLSTNQTGQVDESVWLIKKVGDYYHIIHKVDNKYLTINEIIINNQKHRKRVHLELRTSPDEDNLFNIEYNGSAYYNISHKTLTQDGHKYLNPSGGNKTWDSGKEGVVTGGTNDYSGIVGLFKDASDNGSKWNLTFVKKCVTPEITVDGSGNVTITSVTADATIYYTTDNTNPANSETRQTYSGAFELGSTTVIRAIATKATFTDSEVAAYRTGNCQRPTITLNKETGLTTITPQASDEGAKIYYTIDGTTPTTLSTEYTEAFTLSVDATAIKAIAAFSAEDASTVAEPTLTKLAPPTFTKDGATVTIAKPTKESDGTTDIVGPEAVEVRYNLNNNDPASNSTLYSSAITLEIDFGQTTIKARAFKPGYIKSDVASQSIVRCATPTIVNNEDGTVTISCATEGAAIKYTTSTTESAPSDPNKNSTAVGEGGSVTLPAGTTMIKARAFIAGYAQSSVMSYSIPKFSMPKITNNGTKIIITCKAGGTIYYSTSASGTPSTPYPEGGIDPAGVTIVRAYATHAGYLDSEIKSWIPATLITSASQVDLDDPDGNYIINGSFSGSIGTAEKPFKGTIDGLGVVISGLSAPLVAYAEGATIKNVILDDVTITISSGSSVTVGEETKVATGAIVNVATGATRIYNCGVLATGTGSTVEKDDDGYDKFTSYSSTISGTDYVGGIAGFLDGSSRVINCFSYAKIIAGSYVGGIVGWNNVATTSANLKTMVMNCMFYGDLTGVTGNKAPIYNGQIITNRSDASGVSNFNYFSAEASYVKNKDIQTYNCALLAETRYLQRFEFFRHLLNSNRALAAWWATDDADNKDEMMKWVMEPSQIGTTTPYPILKSPFDDENEVVQYPSVVNIDAAHAEAFSADAATAKTQYNQGRKLGELEVTIQMGTGGAQFGAPDGASIKKSSITLNITDKDPNHFNFNYGKVQLPYYNDVGTKNYTGNRVVTGWKIVSITGGTEGSFTTGTEADANTNGDITSAPYNFADRHCTNKDLYSVSGRIFNQGAYWDVPEGVTAITIQPYWAQAVYCADSYLDEVYNQDMSKMSTVTTVGGGELFSNGASRTINGDYQKVYNTIDGAAGQLSTKGGVYDNAIVLVGNVHSLDLSNKTVSKPYTVMSIDLDNDHEPDYSYILRFNGRTRVHPVRVDFLNVIGLGMAQKSNGGTGTYNLGIMQPLGWFEVTNTGLFRVTQFEYDKKDRVNSPMILQGGVIEQWVTTGQREQTTKEGKTVTYYHVGGNVWFKEFHIGVHQDKIQDEFVSPHPPISVTGGDFNEFYLTGLYNTPNANYDDNAECYINGGRFGKVSGTGMQGIGVAANNTGNIIWQIDNADIDEFYAGGINAAHKAEGNITTVISNSRVDQFCGGPKFGDMNSSKKVYTTATNCTFRAFFGAGYGGNSYNRYYPMNKDNLTSDPDWNGWVSTEYTKDYNSTYGGVSTRIDYQYIPQSDNAKHVARLFVDFISFSLATTYDVTSKLTGCTITRSPLGRLDLFSECIGNFYGGGSLGKVAGPVKSTLTNCTVEGNVFGAGYSATLPTVEVMDNAFQTEPRYDNNLGVYFAPTFPNKTTYEWRDTTVTVNSTATAIDKTKHILYTNIDLSPTNLGSVSGAVTLTITTSGDNTSIIGTEGVNTTGHVYGGGDESTVKNANTPTAAKTNVTIEGNTTVHGDVYGGGNRGIVSGSTTVNVKK